MTDIDIMMCVVDGRLDVNVALNRPSWLSSVWSGSEWGTFWPRKGNDGNKTHCDVETPLNSIVHTGVPETNPWFAVDLGVPLHVFGVNMTNIAAGEGECIRCFVLDSSNQYINLVK